VTALGAPSAKIVMLGFVEIHFHLLPGLDDGPHTLEEAVWLARTAASEGTRTIVATPHVNSVWAFDVSTLPERVRQVSERLRRGRVPIGVLGGGELAHHLVDRLSERQLDYMAQGPPGHRWLLLEAPLTGLDETFTAAADQLRQRGFGIVVAHPERSLANVQAGWRSIEHEVQAGSAMQVNAWSVAGLHGERARIDALNILRMTRRVAISSDAHGPHRVPSLRLAMDILTRLGHNSPRRLVSTVPQALLSNGLPGAAAELAA
jgi:protein-tyrosine phosphatase